VFWYSIVFGLLIDEREFLLAKSHAYCRHRLMDIQEGKRGKAIEQRGPFDKATDEIVRLPCSPTVLFAVKEIAKRTGVSVSESHCA